VVLNPSGSVNISLQEGDELSVRVEARNAISSVPVFLEASAIIARIFPNVILEPITLRKQNEPNVILPFNLSFDTDNNPTGTVLFLGGPTAQQTSPVTEWENESLFPREYIWIRGNDVVGTGPTYTIVEEDKDSVLSVELTVRNGNSSARRTGFLVVGNPPEDTGFTDLTQFIAIDSRIVYVAANGDDAAAAQAKGRGFYLPGDPEIGSDPTQPVGAVVAYASYAAARARMRDGEPDWLLFLRGDTFSSFDPAWTSEVVQVWRGRSAAERAVVAAYGDPNLPRPILLSGQMASASDRKRAFFFVRAGLCMVASLEPRWSGDLSAGSGPALISIRGTDTSANDILLEDIFFRGSAGVVQGQRLTLRRCVIADAFNTGSGHAQGMFDGGNGLVVEECVFDRNGYKEDPNNPFTWTRSVSANGMAAGTGLQPRRDFFCRNMYLTGAPAVPPTLRGNIISRGAGGGSVQMRDGGIAERNLFIWNEQALLTSHGQQAYYTPQPSRPNWIGFNSTEKKYRFNSQTQEFDPNGDILRVPTPGVDFPLPAGAVRYHVDAAISDNLLMHDDHMLPPGGWGIGFQARGTRYLSVIGNILAHFHRGPNSHWPGSGLGGIPENNSDYYPYPTTTLATGIFTDNAVLREQGGNSSVGGLLNLGGGAPLAISAFVGGNAIAGTLNAPKVVQNRLLTSDDHEIGTAAVGGNLYLGTGATPFQYRRPDGTIAQGSFSQYRSDTGWEPESAYFTSLSSLAAAAGWTAPERDIVSYMQSIDPTYVPDENVTVDHGVPAENRRPNAPRVWEVLTSTAYGGHAAPWWGDALGGDVANAKLTARRYHAFLTFIERAKANRKGAWDPRYTAEAVNNYMREGFGKQPVSGPYDTRPIEDRFSDYIQ
jgi:hypothetical protein